MKAAAIAIVFAISAHLCHGEISFLRRDISLRGGSVGLPWSLTAGDFNGDQRPDLVIVNQSGVSIFLNTGNGTFGRARHTSLNVTGPVMAVDANGDGLTDLVSAGYWRFDGSVFLGRGDGTFASERPLPGCGWPAVAADFNGDGRVDVACSNRGGLEGNLFGIRLGNGDGTFRRTNQAPGLFWPYALASGDFNRDGNLDLAANAGSAGGTGIFVLLSNGDGTLAPPNLVLAEPPEGRIGEALLAADFNNDGLLDLVTEYAVVLGTGDGIFRSQLIDDEERSQENARGLTFAAADFDLDGVPDLVRGNDSPWYAQNTVSVFRGKQDGTTSRAMVYMTGWGPSSVLATDLDGDGRPDIATLNRIANTISLLLSRSDAEPGLTRAVSAASSSAIVAPGSLATLHVTVPGIETERANTTPWPTLLAGVALEVEDSAGASLPARLLYVSETQINFLVPEATATGEALLIMIRGEERVQVGTLQVEPVAPAVWLVNDWRMAPLAFEERVDAEGRRSMTPAYTCDDQGDCESVFLEPSSTGSTLVFLVTGFGNATVDSVQCAIKFEPMLVERVRAHTTPGIQEIHVRLPPEEWEFWYYTPNAGVQLTIDGVLANTAQMNFKTRSAPAWPGY
jgi:uncharacterized protein (TIGR03437 family)